MPADGAARPTARFSSVVLPAPFGPTSAATCPAGIASVHSRSAHVPPYRLPRPLVSMMFMLSTPSVSPLAAPPRVRDPLRRSWKSRSALVNSATIPSSSSPAPSAAVSHPSRAFLSPASSGRATWLSVAWMNVPWPGRPAVRPLVSSSL